MNHWIVREHAEFPAVVVAAFAVRNAAVLILLATFVTVALLRPY